MVTLAIAAVYALPPLAALFLSRSAKSRIVKHLIFGVATFCLIAAAFILLAHLDCDYNDFSFVRCGVLPDLLAKGLGFFHILYAIAYLIGGPVLLVLAAILEMIVRSKD